MNCAIPPRPSHSPAAKRRLRGALGAVASIFALSGTASAQIYELYPIDVQNATDWVRTQELLGAPNNSVCDNSLMWAANVNGSPTQVSAFNFESIPGASGKILVNVWVDVLASFRNGDEGEIRVRVVRNNGEILTTKVRCMPASNHQTCNWVFATASSPYGSRITGAIVDHVDISVFSQLNVLVNRNVNGACSNTSNFKLKAIKLTVEVADDCNHNGVDDATEINSVTDCNQNGVLDECEPGYADCNNNLRWDICDPGYRDCNGNGVWDICDPGYVDCNGDGVWDMCEPDYADCNGNNQHDECDIASGISTDCDGDGVPDDCQIAANGILDLNGNGTLDSCEYAGTPYCGPAVPNSTQLPAVLVAIGTDSLSQSNLDLWCGQLPTNANGYFLVSQSFGVVPNAGNSVGTLCISGPGLGRYNQFVFQATSTGIITMGVDPTQIPQPSGPISAQVGQTWNFQAWYRDTLGTQVTSNFSNAVRVTFTP